MDALQKISKDVSLTVSLYFENSVGMGDKMETENGKRAKRLGSMCDPFCDNFVHH